MGRILLVDENLVTRSMTRKTLLMAGHHVVDASGGKDALGAVDAARFDAIVIDMALSDMDGTEVIERIRSMAGHQHTPIIALAEAEFSTATLTSFAGTPTTRVRKPFTPHELTDEIARALSAATPVTPDQITLPDAERSPQRET